MKVHELSRQDARRIAVRAQLLDMPRPTDLLDVVRHLTLLQMDPTSAVAPSADLVLWSRLGSRYATEQLADAIDSQALIDLRGLVRPVEDMVLYRAEMARWPGPEPLREWQRDIRDWVRANDACRVEILDQLRGDGPLPASELPRTCAVAWRSSGWNDNRSVRMLLSLMVQRGEVAAAGGVGRARLWDLAERVYPADPVVDVDEALRIRNERALRSLGIARARGPQSPVESLGVGDAGEPAVIDGVRGEWRVESSLLGQPFSGRACVLSPFDRLVNDRKRLAELFEFDYYLEMYKPVGQRRWGYFALPILYGDRLVGKLDATADRKVGVLELNAIHQDAPFSTAVASAVNREVEELASWLELELAVLDTG